MLVAAIIICSCAVPAVAPPRVPSVGEWAGIRAMKFLKVGLPTWQECTRHQSGRSIKRMYFSFGDSQAPRRWLCCTERKARPCSAGIIGHVTTGKGGG